jgi:hypothetical protein
VEKLAFPQPSAARSGCAQGHRCRLEMEEEARLAPPWEGEIPCRRLCNGTEVTEGWGCVEEGRHFAVGFTFFFFLKHLPSYLLPCPSYLLRHCQCREQ